MAWSEPSGLDPFSTRACCFQFWSTWRGY